MSQENVDVAKAAFEAVGRGDLDEFLSLIDLEVTFNSLVTEADEAFYNGHDGARRWFETVTRTFGHFRTDPEILQDVGEDCVLAKLVLRGMARGAEVTQIVWQTSSYRGGKIVSWTIHRDKTEALEAAGLSE